MTTPSFDAYMRAYRADHEHPINRLTHLVGIPLIVASLPVIPFARRVGLGMFAAGWALQFTGHFFEGKKPSFASDPRYLAIGPIWVAVEWVELLTGLKLYNAGAEPDATPASSDA